VSGRHSIGEKTEFGDTMHTDIDITFDFRCDTPEGKDPDQYSKTLRRYHKLLWSKRLPSGEFFQLDDTTPGAYLHHKSALGEFALSSDTVIPSFKWVPHIKASISQAEIEAFNASGYTIGGMMVFPGKSIDRKWTINQARGCTKAIGDRFDLTLECIRRHYSALSSPMSGVLARYADFFHLFTDFRGYVEFFLLQDLVTEGCSAVKIAAPFDDFNASPIPASLSEYNAYKRSALAFIEARNQRIQAFGLTLKLEGASSPALPN
jgi:hypothetical protein